MRALFVFILLSAVVRAGFAAETTTYLPHYTFLGGAWETVLSVNNAAQETRTVTVRAYTDEGVLQTQTVWTLHPGETRHGAVNALIPDLTAERGWLEMTGDDAGVTGIMKFTAVTPGGSSSLPLIGQAAPKLVFPLVENNDAWSGGFAVINPADSQINMELELVALDGRVLERKREVLAARSKRLSMLPDLFEGDIPETATFRVIADGDILGFALTFAADVSQIVAVPATPLSGGLPETVPASELRGFFNMQGYDRYFTADENLLNQLESTNGTCYFRSEALPHDFLDDLISIQAHADGSIVAGVADSITTYRLTPAETSLPECAYDPGTSNDPELNFETFWELFERNYIFFEQRGVDWQEAYNVYRPQVTSATGDNRLFDIMVEMLEPLNDGHIALQSSFNSWDGGGLPQPFEMLRQEFENQSEITDLGTYFNQVAATWQNNVLTRYGNGSAFRTANNQLMWTRFNDGTAYLKIWAFTGFGGDNNVEDLIIFEQAVAAVMNDLSNTERMIIDVRFNGGGNDGAGVIVANYFADRNRLAFSKRAKTPTGKTAFQSHFLEPKAQPYQGKVVVLCSNSTASASEVFLLQMASIPGVTILGENTRGVFSDVLDKGLPNGWLVDLSNEEYLDHQGVNHEGPGFPPHQIIQFLSPEDRQQGIDSGIEAALQILQE